MGRDGIERNWIAKHSTGLGCGFFDQDEKRLKSAENPFLPKSVTHVSGMDP